MQLSFEEWASNPVTLYDLQRSYEYEADHINQNEEGHEQPATKIEILEEMVACILKEFNICIDVDGIVQCIEKTRNVEYLNYERMDNENLREVETAAAMIRLKEHDFVIKKEG